jgi:hypothetical protein
MDRESMSDAREDYRDSDMALELTPIPIKIAPDTLAILRSEAELTGRHQNEVARQILAEWAERQVHVARIRNKHLKREGFAGIDGSVSE